MSNTLFNRKLLVVVGKGGVGKTTTSAAIGVRAAAEGKRVLIAMCNAQDHLSGLLGVDPIGTEVRNIGPNLDAVNMEPSAALREYGLMVLKVEAIFRAIFDNRMVSAFLRGTPGIDAWALLGKTVFHAFETDSDGRQKYDLVILDAPATGHGLSMLRVPQILSEIAPPGLLRREAVKALTLLRDPVQSAAVVVTLPEVMPTNETLELCAALEDEIGLGVARIVVNRVLPKLFGTEDCQDLEHLRKTLGTAAAPEFGGAMEAAWSRMDRERVQKDSISRLSEGVDAPQTNFPHLFGVEFGRGSLESLSVLL